MISDADLDDIRKSQGKYAQLICNMCKFYRDWHVKSDGVYGNLALGYLFCLKLTGSFS